MLPKIGTMTPASEGDDARYLDFVEGLRVFTTGKVQPTMRPRYDAAVREYSARKGRPPQSVAEVHEAVDTVPAFAARHRIYRTGQEMMWSAIIETYRKREVELLAELDRADQSGPGSVRYNPSFAYPEYVKAVEIHIQPGSYERDPLAGYIYHYGTKVYFGGGNNDDGMHRKQVAQASTPSDGRVSRILEIGCAIGQNTTAWKERFPTAEVWGIDIAAPMVRYAHKRAVEMNSDVHFAQMAAEQLEFPDAQFDIVHSFLLFHEIPVPIIRQVIREACRVLRPGGLFNVWDLGAFYSQREPLSDYFLEWLGPGIGEWYAWDYAHLDFPAELRAGGFRDIRQNGGEISASK